MTILEKIENFILYLTVFLIPLVFLTLFANPFSPTKVIILTFGVALILFVKAIRVIVEGSLQVSTTSFDFPIILLLIAYLASAILKTPNKMEAFFMPGTASVIFASGLLYFFISNLKKKEKETLSGVIFLSGLTAAIISLLSFSGVFTYIPQLPSFVADPSFNPLGGQLPLVIFLAVIIPLGINQILSQKELVKKVFSGFAIAILVLSLVLATYNILPGKSGQIRFIDYKTSWSVTIDALKESPVLGIGPANFLTAFNRFKPLSYNLTDHWMIKFSSARNYYLTALTEVGLLGGAALILIFSVIYKLLRKNLKEKKIFGENTPLLSLIILLILFAFFAAVVNHLVLLFVFLALAAKSRAITLNFSAQTTKKGARSLASRLPSFLVVLPVIIVLIVFAVFSSRVLIAEVKYRDALDALVINDGITTYESLREAINTNPYIDRYHATYSQVNLALANSLALVEEPTDEDRATITQLIQQAIEEAKATVALNPSRSGNWEVLARTYQAIVAFAEGADQFSIQSFNQAIALDPLNPNLRITLGGIYYSLGNYDAAIEVFKLAVLAKSDYANAHYNLAFAYKEKGDIDNAIQAMTVVLSLADENSSDYQSAKTELENLEQRKLNEEGEFSENLAPPQTGEESTTAPLLELPEDLAPPTTPDQ